MELWQGFQGCSHQVQAEHHSFPSSHVLPVTFHVQLHPSAEREEGSAGAGTDTAIGRLVFAGCSGGICGCKCIYSVCKWCQPVEQYWAGQWDAGSFFLRRCLSLGVVLARSNNEGSLPAHLPAVPTRMTDSSLFLRAAGGVC